MALTISASWGETIDKISILEIKSARISDPNKLVNIKRELEALNAIVAEAGGLSTEAAIQAAALAMVNAELWDIENSIRHYEKNGDFGADFIALARSVYQTNDRRAALKREINLMMESSLIEEKSYSLPTEEKVIK